MMKTDLNFKNIFKVLKMQDTDHKKITTGLASHMPFFLLYIQPKVKSGYSSALNMSKTDYFRKVGRRRQLSILYL